MESKFTGGLLGLIGISILQWLLILVTLGLGVPWAICLKDIPSLRQDSMMMRSLSVRCAFFAIMVLLEKIRHPEGLYKQKEQHPRILLRVHST